MKKVLIVLAVLMLLTVWSFAVPTPVVAADVVLGNYFPFNLVVSAVKVPVNCGTKIVKAVKKGNPFGVVDAFPSAFVTGVEDGARSFTMIYLPKMDDDGYIVKHPYLGPIAKILAAAAIGDIASHLISGGVNYPISHHISRGANWAMIGAAGEAVAIVGETTLMK